MKYSVDIHLYPHNYEVEAENPEEAKEKAKAKFHEEYGNSIYETKVEKAE